MFLMNLLNKVSKKLRWLRWSTVLAILFYMFFIGLILHSTTYKFQNNVKSQLHKNQQQQQQQQQEKPIQTQTQNRAQASEASEASEWGLAATRAEELSKTHEMNAYKTVKVPRREEETELSAVPPISSLSSAALSSALASALVSLAAKATNDAAGTFSPSVKKIRRTTTTTTVKRAKWSSTAPEAVILVTASVNEKHILEKAFKRADRNQDRFLSIQELGQSINRNIVEHIDEAIRLNAKEFRRVDIAPADGLITWDEYHRFFLKEHGMTEADIDEHNEIKHTALNRKAREDMMRDKARWSEAARTDLFTLTIDEYLSFRHPESSISNLLELVDDLLRQFDQDGDDQLSIEEFSEVNVADDDDLVRKSLISKTVVERKEEFKRIIDKNRDGRADRGELLNYVNPKTPRYALQEAATLFSLCDEDHNGKLSLKELLSNAEIFLTSKLIDTAHSFHTEF